MKHFNEIHNEMIDEKRRLKMLQQELTQSERQEPHYTLEEITLAKINLLKWVLTIK